MEITIIIAFVGGIFFWSFFEYGMHFWNGHLMKGRTLFSREHLAHHANPDYFTSNWMKLAMATPPALAILAVASWVFGLNHGLALTLGVMSAYAGYEWLHWQIHASGPSTPFGRWARRHHLSHHYKSAMHNHGVTTPIWDMLFGTYRKTDMVKIPQKHAMAWLLDPNTKTLRSCYADDYAIVAKKTVAPNTSSPDMQRTSVAA